jgi:hypothetical protein
MPKIEKAEPMRAKLLRERDEPRCKKSRTDIAAPIRAKVRIDKDAPKVAQSSKDNAAPRRVMPNTE